MWLEKENDQDPYNRANNATGKSFSVGSGGGSGAPIGAGEGSQTTPTLAGTTPTAPVPQQKTATVQDYLGANKDQGNQLGQQFQSKLNDVATNDKKAIDASSTNITGQAKSQTASFDPTLASKAVANPTSTANDPNQLQSFLKQWNASYTGPDTFEGTDAYTTANKAATDAQTHATEVADTGGRKQILQDDFGVYGQGNKGLDQTLLQNSSSFPAIQDTGKSLSTLPGYLANRAVETNQAISKAKDTADQTKNLTRDTINNRVTSLGNALPAQAATIKNTAANIPDTAKNFLSRLPANPDDNDLAMAGLTRGEYQGILSSLGPNLKSTNPNISNPLYATNPEYSQNLANYLALQQIRNKAISSQM